MRDVTFGRYYPSRGPLHETSASLKLLFFALYIVSIFISKTYTGLAVCTAFLLICIFISRVPLGRVLRSFRSIIIIALVSSVIVYLTHPHDGALAAVVLFVRLISAVCVSALLTLTTTPSEIADGLEKSLSFLRFIHVPVRDIALSVSITLHFVPVLQEEAEKIYCAQKARGASFSGSLSHKASTVVAVLVPLFSSAFRRAGELADSMESRCYDYACERTAFHESRFTSYDVLAGLLFAAYFLFTICVRLMPWQ